MATMGRRGSGKPADDRREDAKSLLPAIPHRLEALAPVGLLLLTGAGRIIDHNKTAANLLGVRGGTLVGMQLQAFLPVTERAALASHLVECFRTQGRHTCVLSFANPHGSAPFVGQLDSVGRYERGQGQVVHVALSDATERWRDEERRHSWLLHEQQLRAEAAAKQLRFDRVISLGGELAESLDLDAALQRAVSFPLRDLASYCAIDLVDDTRRVRRVVFARADGHAEDLPLDPYAPQGSASVVRTGEMVQLIPPGFGDLLALSATPDHVAVLREALGSYLCVPLRAHGRTVGAMTFVRGRGERFEADDIVLLEEIARQSAFAIDNARLYREAHEADQRKDEFLAMLGHELRNPLSAIVFASARLRRKSGDEEAVIHTADIVTRQTTRLVRLVDDLLDVSRITRGKIALQPQRIALADVVSRAVESARPLIDERRHVLTVRLSPEPVLLDADPTRLEQVVTNLLVNAAKYTPAGGHISVDVARAGRMGEVRVRDDGIGIEPDQLAAIFAPFTQINAPIDRADRGLGIGLTLARQLVELHGGRITAHSDGAGKGTEMLVRIPLAEGPSHAHPANGDPGPVPDASVEDAASPTRGGRPGAEPALAETTDPALPPLRWLDSSDALRVDATEVPPPAASGPRRRVLVVEDHPDVAAMLHDELAAMGQEVRVAHDGNEAMDTALDFVPELMLVDIGLPGESGYDLARRLRQEPGLAETQLVALTGYGGADTTRQCKEAGFDEHCTKPISEDMLRSLLHR